MKITLEITLPFVCFWALTGLIANALFQTPHGPDWIHQPLNECYCKIPTKWKSHHSKITHRGSDYFMTTYNKKLNRQDELIGCVITGWNLSHFIVHFVSAVIFPECWGSQLLLGIVFELIEFPICHDTTDIWVNILGMMLGLFISPYFYQTK
jgi:hypothetical protein